MRWLGRRASRHCHSEVLLAVEPAVLVLFAHRDDHRRLSSHMEKPSWIRYHEGEEVRYPQHRDALADRRSRCC